VKTLIAIVMCAACSHSAPPPAQPAPDPAPATPAADPTVAARAKVDALMKELDAQNLRVNAAVDAVVAAKSDAERSAAKVKLTDEQKKQSDLKAQVSEAKSESMRAEREKGVHVSEECKANPLAKGCQ
jgi:PBP1b-binding outer membrane lipoprotein LpoB